MIRQKYLLLVTGSLFSFFIFLACNDQSSDAFDPTEEFVFQEKLSDYGFFEGALAQLNPTESVLPYELNTPLFSDYAHKARFIKLPKETSMSIDEDALNFPDGTILIKNFFYFHNEQVPENGKRLIETRLLIKQGEDWAVANYEWNEAQTEAPRNILGGKKTVSWVNKAGDTQKTQYIIPDNNDCKSCHKKNGYVVPIGPKINNLNKDLAAGGTFKNQLQQWQEMGFISNLNSTEELPKLPDWDDAQSYAVANRARAYLEVNCAHCHSEDGPASNTGLFLNYEQEEAHRIGILKGPVSAAQGSGSLKYNIVPGDSDASIMVYRINSAETGIAMPELGKTMVHEEGVQLIAQWIDQMKE